MVRRSAMLDRDQNFGLFCAETDKQSHPRYMGMIIVLKYLALFNELNQTASRVTVGVTPPAQPVTSPSSCIHHEGATMCD
jgi:hypothetical protein